jgi:hypothetical protein
MQRKHLQWTFPNWKIKMQIKLKKNKKSKRESESYIQQKQASKLSLKSCSPQVERKRRWWNGSGNQYQPSKAPLSPIYIYLEMTGQYNFLLFQIYTQLSNHG